MDACPLLRPPCSCQPRAPCLGRVAGPTDGQQIALDVCKEETFHVRNRRRRGRRRRSSWAQPGAAKGEGGGAAQPGGGARVVSGDATEGCGSEGAAGSEAADRSMAAGGDGVSGDQRSDADGQVREAARRAGPHGGRLDRHGRGEVGVVPEAAADDQRHDRCPEGVRPASQRAAPRPQGDPPRPSGHVQHRDRTGGREHNSCRLDFRHLVCSDPSVDWLRALPAAVFLLQRLLRTPRSGHQQGSFRRRAVI
mmetsp:Transcript_17410/g.57633  ORF Transcript_17410/g.57633 Transcript_17410/m.57633 type:complete len:251 (+) Transcript_17410:100-852(+)